jgi:hypothetical protein
MKCQLELGVERGPWWTPRKSLLPQVRYSCTLIRITVNYPVADSDVDPSFFIRYRRFIPDSELRVLVCEDNKKCEKKKQKGPTRHNLCLCIRDTERLAMTSFLTKFGSFVQNLKSNEIWIMCKKPNCADNFF